jgi:hypothetical protein
MHGSSTRREERERESERKSEIGMERMGVHSVL